MKKTKPQLPRGRPAPLGRKISVTIRLTPACVDWLDSWGPQCRSWAIENLIRADPTFKAGQKSNH